MTSTAVGPGLSSILSADRIDDKTNIVRPRSTAEVAQLLRTATEENWTANVRGGGTWYTPAAGDFTISTLNTESGCDLQAADLVVTAGAGTRLSALRRELDAQSVWLPCDPPGEDRTIGSMVGTGTSGPLAHGFGAVRDQILGLTVVTGAGHILTLGGRVVKNVAGFDLIRLMTGTFGAYGVITMVTLRVRALPAADRTLRCQMPLERATRFMEALNESRIHPSACSLHASPPGDAHILVRLMGSDPHVRLLADQINGMTSSRFDDLEHSEAMGLWAHGAIGRGTSSVRLAYQPSQVSSALALIQAHLPGGTVEISPAFLRWNGGLSAQTFAAFRTDAVALGMTVALERAPEHHLRQAGHYMRARNPLRNTLDRLQNTFDPARVITHSLEGAA